MVKVLLSIALMFGLSNIAISQEKAPVEAETTVTKLEAQPEAEAVDEKVDVVQEPETQVDWATKVGAFMFGLYVFLWGLGEALTRIAVYTKNNYDNKVAAWISQIVWFIGSFAGRMGWKLPKLVILAEAEKIQEKQEKKS